MSASLTNAGPNCFFSINTQHSRSDRIATHHPQTFHTLVHTKRRKGSTSHCSKLEVLMISGAYCSQESRASDSALVHTSMALSMARRIYSAEELHRLRNTDSQPKLREAIEEHDGEEAELIKGQSNLSPGLLS
jgi:hypothetical protein